VINQWRGKATHASQLLQVKSAQIQLFANTTLTYPHQNLARALASPPEQQCLQNKHNSQAIDVQWHHQEPEIVLTIDAFTCSGHGMYSSIPSPP
jgi:hypothetical protein